MVLFVLSCSSEKDEVQVLSQSDESMESSSDRDLSHEESEVDRELDYSGVHQVALSKFSFKIKNRSKFTHKVKDQHLIKLFLARLVFTSEGRTSLPFSNTNFVFEITSGSRKKIIAYESSKKSFTGLKISEIRRIKDKSRVDEIYKKILEKELIEGETRDATAREVDFDFMRQVQQIDWDITESNFNLLPHIQKRLNNTNKSQSLEILFPIYDFEGYRFVLNVSKSDVITSVSLKKINSYFEPNARKVLYSRVFERNFWDDQGFLLEPFYEKRDLGFHFMPVTSGKGVSLNNTLEVILNCVAPLAPSNSYRPKDYSDLYFYKWINTPFYNYDTHQPLLKCTEQIEKGMLEEFSKKKSTLMSPIQKIFTLSNRERKKWCEHSMENYGGYCGFIINNF
jgi:hypothetical protein